VNRLTNIATLTLLLLGVNLYAVAQPTLTHVDNVNAAGNGTLHWEVFTPSVGGEEFVHNEVKVFDLSMNLLSLSPHIIGPDLDPWVLPTGWVTPSFMYNLTDLAHCFSAEQITTFDGGVTQTASPSSPFLCSIHISAVVGAGPGEIDLSWNSPYALSGTPAGGDFSLEKLSAQTALWEVIATIPDNSMGGTFTENPGPCESIHIYRITQTASNGVDLNVSNTTNLITGSGNNDAPVTTHVDVDPATGLAVVYFTYEVTVETLGYIIYKCTPSGESEVLQLGNPNATSASIPTSLATLGPESYRIAAFDCINDDGTPNPNAAGDCTSSIFTVATQIPCTDRAQISWNEPFGMDGGVSTYTIEASLFDLGSGLWSAWYTLDVLANGFGTYLHDGADVSSTYRYRVVAESTTGNIARSNNHELTFVYPESPDAPVLSRASVLSDGSVEIIISTDPSSTEISFYQLEKFVDYNGEWDPILEPQPSSLGLPVSFVDTNVDTDSKSYTYRCIAFNECGAEVNMSNIGKTILLNGWRSLDPEAYLNNLIWTEYEAFPLGVGSYELLRADTRYDVSAPLSSHPFYQLYSEDYVGDLIELPGDFCYTVIAVENSSGTGLNGASSNKVCLTEDPLIWIPTAFTPNGDGLNDWFPWSPNENTMGFVSNSLPDGTPVFDLMILSRWGDTLFESEDVNECWDGTVNGNEVPDGVYTAILKIIDGSGKWHVVSQSIQVLRP
jgi:gliding motility-associated-like protein